MYSRVGFLILVATASVATAVDNGLGTTPPRGWRSWNQFDTNIHQDLIEAQYAALVARTRQVNGVATSLLDLGYASAGIDDGWQKCNSGPDGVGFHDANGYPIVDTSKFPDMKAMTAKARSLGLTAGWYVNNCECKEARPSCAFTNGSDTCFAGDVAATLAFGFSALKIDSCGIQRNMSHYAHLFNLSGTAVVLEDCHNGNPYHPTRSVGDRVDCPMNLFRTSGDIRPQWGSILSNLMTTSEFNSGLAGPGCWGYPDMLEVGVSQMPARGGLNFLNPVETRTHFAAWCIVSSPLTLSHDLTNDTTMDAVWPIISNREALAVNDAWVGDAGVLVKKSDEMVPFTNCAWGFNMNCEHAASMVWKKQLPDGKMAILLMNNLNITADVNISWSADLPPDLQFRCSAGGCPVRDIYTHTDLGVYAGGFTAKGLAPHDSAFVVVQQCVKEPTYPFHCVSTSSV
jgi:alpha-galactosidase